MAAPVFIPRPDPLTVLVPVWGAVWGVAGAATLRFAPAADSAGIPRWGLYVFFLGLAFFSVMALLGMLRRNLGNLRTELWGQTGLGSICLCYSLWAVQAYGLRGYIIETLLITICVASFWQARRLNAWLSSKG